MMKKILLFLTLVVIIIILIVILKLSMIFLVITILFVNHMLIKAYFLLNFFSIFIIVHLIKEFNYHVE